MPNTSNNGMRATTQTYQHEISRGRVPGAELFGGVGKLTATAAVTKNIIWPNGVFIYPDQVSGETLNFVSSNAADNPAGTGLAQIEVHYLDINLEPQEVLVTLNGVTPVTQVTFPGGAVGPLSGVRFIQCMHVQTPGSATLINPAAAGIISAYREGAPTAVFSLISATQERCTSSLRMVPKGKRGFVAGAVGSGISGTAAAGVLVELVASELDNHQYTNPFILLPFGSIGVQDNGVQANFPAPLSFREGTLIGMRTTSDKAAIITGDWFGWLEDAGE